jgi:hypothetical protein
MRAHNLYWITVLFCVQLFYSCKNAGKTSSVNIDTINYSNITILLDLSDRVDSAKTDQILRDTSLIKAVLMAFEEQVKNHGYIYSKDKIQVLVAPQAGNSPINFNPHIDIEEEIKNNPSKVIRQTLPDKETQFLNEVKTIYAHHQKFTGADIWTFFKNTPEQDLIKKSFSESSKDENVYHKFHNKLFILTDGYLNFDAPIQKIRKSDNTAMQMAKLRNDNNWSKNFEKYKLAPINNRDFSGLEIMLLEIDPQNPEINVNESDIIIKYWQQWFADMSNNKFYFHQRSESIPLIASSINNFITSH